MPPNLLRLISRAREVMDGRDAFAANMAGARHAATSPWSGLPEPTKRQEESGVYPKGYMTWNGLGILVENPVHTVREGMDPDGTPWRNVMKASYGYFAGTLGADGDEVDVFMGPLPEAGTAWVLNQRNPDGSFDEHKVLVGFHDERAAVDAYRLSYSAGWDRYGPPIALSHTRLQWWLANGDHTRELTPESVPMEFHHMDAIKPLNINRVFWDSAAQPLCGQTLGSLLYALRLHDADEGLLLDGLTMADLMEGEDGKEVLDALVIQAGRLKPKMDALMRIMEAAGDAVKPIANQISDPIRRFGGAHVAAIFELSDGQTVTAWFHNPDSTPNKLSPADELVSWKWQLNKKDVTIVVAPESGQDLNLREVARRVMRLAAKNSAAFAKSNAGRAGRMAEIAGLRDTLATKQGELAGLNQQIEVAKVTKDGRANAKPAWMSKDAGPIDAPGVETSDKYLRLLSAGESALEYWQDRLDSIFGERIVAIRNALRKLGWDGAAGESLTREGATADASLYQVGAGKNVVGVIWTVTGNIKTGYGDGTRDDLSLTPEEFAAELDSSVMAAAEPSDEDKAATVRGAYPFASASTPFLAWLWDSLGEDSYSPFLTASTMDRAAQAGGAAVAWDFFTGHHTLTDAVKGGEDEIKPTAPAGEPDATAKGSDTAAAAKKADEEAKPAEDAKPAEGEAKKPAAKDDDEAKKADANSGEESDDDTDAETEFEATPEEGDDGKKPVMDGDFAGHPFRGNQYKHAGEHSRGAVGASMRAKHAEKKGNKAGQRKSHAAAFHAHSAAAIGSKGKARGYHKKMAKFHAGRAGMRHDSIRLDGIPALDGQEYVGKVSKGGAVIARIDIGGDGKAMVFLGETGTDRVSDGSDRKAFYSQDPETTASYIEDLLKQVAAKWVAPVVTDPEPVTAQKFYVMLGDQSVSEHDDIEAAAAAGEVVAKTDPFAHEGVWVGDTDGNYLREIRAAGLGEPQPQPTPPAVTEDPSGMDIALLADVNRGAHDDAALDNLLSMIETAIQNLQAAGKLTGETETIANSAITRWVELDQKANG